MDLSRFGAAPPWSLGVEEELMLVDAETLEPARDGFSRVFGEETARIKPELLEDSFLLEECGQHQIGIAGGIDQVDLDPVGSHQRPRHEQSGSGRRPEAQDLTTAGMEFLARLIIRLALGGRDHGSTIRAVMPG